MVIYVISIKFTIPKKLTQYIKKYMHMVLLVTKHRFMMLEAILNCLLWSKKTIYSSCHKSYLMTTIGGHRKLQCLVEWCWACLPMLSLRPLFEIFYPSYLWYCYQRRPSHTSYDNTIKTLDPHRSLCIYSTIKLYSYWVLIHAYTIKQTKMEDIRCGLLQF